MRIDIWVWKSKDSKHWMGKGCIYSTGRKCRSPTREVSSLECKRMRSRYSRLTRAWPRAPEKAAAFWKRQSENLISELRYYSFDHRDIHNASEKGMFWGGNSDHHSEKTYVLTLLHLSKVSESIMEARFAWRYRSLHCLELFPPKKLQKLVTWKSILWQAF